MQTVNLIPAHRVLKRKRAVRTLRWTTVCGVYGVLVFVACIGSFTGLQRADTRQLDIRIETVNAEIEETKQELGRLKQGFTEAEQKLLATGAVGPQPDWSILLTALAAETGPQIVLSTCQLAPAVEEEPAAGEDAHDPQRVEAFVLHVAGFGRTQRDVSDFVLRLEETSLLDSVSLVNSRREPFLADHAIAFEVQCSIEGGEEDAR
jgi:Tfp pilus assembly protein PilN